MYINFSQSRKCRKLKSENEKIYKFEEGKLEVDSDKSWSSNSDIHGGGDIEQEQEEDNEEISQITNIPEFNESERITNKIFLLNKFNLKWSITKRN